MKPLKTKLYLLFSIVLVIGVAIVSCEGPMGPEGPQGPQGEQGPPGPVGPAGTDGSIIHAGEGAPEGNTGKTGDFYLDMTTGNLYGPKMAEGWGVPTNLQGPQGPRGEEGPAGPEGPQGPEGPRGPAGEDGQDGEQGPQGPQGPAGEDGQDGEQGPEGPQGPAGEDGQDGQDGQDGSQIFAGSGAPDTSLGQEGDYYLDKADFDLYGPKTSSGWGTPINLQGPQGDPGPAGPEGPAGTTDHGMLTGLGDDDHTQYVLVDGVRDATDGFAVTGTFRSGTIPVEGEGPRLMWYPGKAAFRAGRVSGDRWDDVNIGGISTAMGFNTTASGGTSTAMGNNTTASGTTSTAIGLNTTASDDFSTAMGSGTTASGSASTAMGGSTTASGTTSTAIGLSTTASGDYSTAMGFSTIAGGDRSVAMGLNTTAATETSLSIGHYNAANTTDDNTLFVAGNGTFSSPSDALVLDFDGNLTLAGEANATSHNTTSDRRLKENITPLEEGVLGQLGEIRPVYYRFKEEMGHPTDPQLGLIAQEVQAHFPELVSEGDDGFLSLSYSNFTAVLLKGLQEQQAEIETQREQIAQLQARANRVDELEARLARLEGVPNTKTGLTTGASLKLVPGMGDTFPAGTGWWLFGGLLAAIALYLGYRHRGGRDIQSFHIK